MPGPNALLPATVILPVRREGTQLASLLSTLKSFERVVVVDSDDDPTTRELADSHGADYMVFRWQGGYPKKRTWALRNAEIITPWVLFLDADEVPTESFLVELQQTLPRSRAVGYWLRYDTLFLGRRLRFGVRQRKLALVRYGAGEYEAIADPGWTDLDMEVHEHLVVNGTVDEIRASLIHQDCKTIDGYVRRHSAYATWEARRFHELQANPEGKSRLTRRQRVKYALAENPLFPLIYFILQYIVRLGFLDGAQGLRFALLKAGYFAEVSAKIAELRLSGKAVRS